jgi:hypothetical protein
MVFFSDHLYAQINIGSVRKHFVVSANQQNFCIIQGRPPFAKKLMLDIGKAVKKIACNKDGAGLEPIHQTTEPIDIFLKKLIGYGYARLSEMRHFPDVQITEQQQLLLLPKNTPCWA